MNENIRSKQFTLDNFDLYLDLGEFDKNEKDTIEEALNLRNRCGHPGKYRPGIKKASSFIEDIISVVFK